MAEIPPAMDARPRKSLCDLPEDVLGRMLEHLAKRLKSEYRDYRLNDELRNCMLTCKRLVAPARRLLYQDPLSCSYSRMEAKDAPYSAWRLRQTLLDNKASADAVRTLNFAGASLASNLPTQIAKHASAMTRVLYRRSYQVDLIRACGGASKFDVSLDAPEAAAQIAALLQDRTTPISTLDVSIIALGDVHASEIVDAFVRNLGSCSPTLNSIWYQLDTKAVSKLVSARRLAYSAREIFINVSARSIHPADLVALLPKKLGGVSALVIAYELPASQSDTKISESLKAPVAQSRNSLASALRGNQLEHFSITDVDRRATSVKLEDYHKHNESGGTTFSEAFFRLFPHAVTLTLHRGRAMTLAKLKALADTSPSLGTLDLSYTTWSISESDVCPSVSSTSFLQKLVDELDRFPRLQSVDLGIWPFDDDEAARKRNTDVYAWRTQMEDRYCWFQVLGCPQSYSEDNTPPRWPDDMSCTSYEDSLSSAPNAAIAAPQARAVYLTPPSSPNLLLKLPDDLLGVIVDTVTGPPPTTWVRARPDLRDLSAMSLTCRRLADVTRSRRFRSLDIRAPYRSFYDKISNLGALFRLFHLRQIILQTPKVAACIRRLSFRPEQFSADAQQDASPFAPAMESAVRSWRYQEDLLRACRNLIGASIVLETTTAHARDLASTLRDAELLTLACSFVEPKYSASREVPESVPQPSASDSSEAQDANTALAAFCDTLANPRQAVAFESFQVKIRWMRTALATLPLRYSASALTIEIDRDDLSDVVSFFPHDISTLRTLEIHYRKESYNFRTPKETDWNRLYAALHTNKLTRVHFPRPRRYDGETDIRDYQYLRMTTGTNYPADFLAMFPTAHAVTFGGGCAMTLEKLSALVSASPGLEEISFESTLWDLSREDLRTKRNREMSKFERRLTEILKPLKRLKEIDLGVWPILDSYEEERWALEDWGEARGLEITIEACIEKEPTPQPEADFWSDEDDNDDDDDDNDDAHSDGRSDLIPLVGDWAGSDQED
ncbi:hypothetical protein JCM10908_003114 [Rhodotorula pacifica]|uniref:uncharacterized protein n=1 Tax=Rhodotorula pacifica TaxID=1495444 RepID=UPI003171A718